MFCTLCLSTWYGCLPTHLCFLEGPRFSILIILFSCLGMQSIPAYEGQRKTFYWSWSKKLVLPSISRPSIHTSTWILPSWPQARLLLRLLFNLTLTKPPPPPQHPPHTHTHTRKLWLSWLPLFCDSVHVSLLGSCVIVRIFSPIQWHPAIQLWVLIHFFHTKIFKVLAC